MAGVHALLLGIPWMDPHWLLHHFHTEFVWVSLVIVFVECGLFFPFLPGDTLLFSVGLFIATNELNFAAGPNAVGLTVACLLFALAAFLGNVAGYEIGRRIGPAVRRFDNRVVRRKHIDSTVEFFEKHGGQALVIGRFVPFVRTYVTLVAGVSEMNRVRFWLWSAVGAVGWVVVITCLGFFLGRTFPWLSDKIDWVILGLLLVTVIPIVLEWWRQRRRQEVTS
ncbi:MAG TPA: VTT domain-containing protein [Nocardioides sp.]|uniref:DedA family protein n=1 Tax=Nocardioides sp. TaxID=35761 RepID=UPI002E314E9A|nr:VTT domain-containing protein [Nocardioides sp.]HEX3932041.1 VTT domain-containing protein [Nocardioides sp.]